MEKIIIATDVKEKVISFAQAVKNKNFELLESLLADNGSFQTLDSELQIIADSSKYEFLAWLQRALQNIQIETVEHNNCSSCKLGNPVVVFNKGEFPRLIIDNQSDFPTGFMLHVVDGFIREIAFCTALSFTESKCHFERSAEEVRQLIDAGQEYYNARSLFPDDGFQYDDLILVDDYVISFVQEAIAKYQDIQQIPSGQLEPILQWREDYLDVEKWLTSEKDNDTVFYLSNRSILDQYLETCDISGDQMYELMGL